MAEKQVFKSLKFYNNKKIEIISLVWIWQEWTTNNKLKELKTMNISDMDMITTTQEIFMMIILIKKNWMG